MTDIGKVKLLIGGLIAGTFTDADIQGFLDMGGSVFMAAALAVEAWILAAMDAMRSETIGDYRYTKADIEVAVALKKNLEARDASTPAYAIAEMDLLDTSITAGDDD